jgi:trehalose/maltose hydrolase-like predicted phosphorylase
MMVPVSACFRRNGTGWHYHVRHVVGPDKYHDVDDGAYTHLMARANSSEGATQSLWALGRYAVASAMPMAKAGDL